MVSLGSYPAVYMNNQAEKAIHAELYLVDEETFARLDQLEGYPDFITVAKLK